MQAFDSRGPGLRLFSCLQFVGDQVADEVSDIFLVGNIVRDLSPSKNVVGDLFCNKGPDLQNIWRQSYDYLTIMRKLR